MPTAADSERADRTTKRGAGGVGAGARAGAGAVTTADDGERGLHERKTRREGAGEGTLDLNYS